MIKGLVILLIILLPVVYSNIYLGTSEGYIFNETNHTISGAFVTVQVSGCSGSNCVQTYTSDSNGYYVVANLDASSNQQLIVSATKNLASGLNSGTTNQYSAAYINVTICTPPSIPILNLVNDTHLNKINFSWNSGIDSLGRSIYDELVLDSVSKGTLSSPHIESNLSFGTHTWKVRTCNSYCCSDYSSDSFDILNSAPSPPVLVAKENTNSQSNIFAWTSGIDSDGDSVYDQISINGNITNATSPYTSTLDVNKYIWKVRTCDEHDFCSAWSEDTFIMTGCSNNCQPNPICPPSGGGSIIYLPNHEFIIYPPYQLYPGDHFSVMLKYKSSSDIDKLTLSPSSIQRINFNTKNYFNLEKNQYHNLLLKGVLANSIESGNYTVNIEVLEDDSSVAVIPFTFTVLSKSVIQHPSKVKVIGDLSNQKEISAPLTLDDEWVFKFSDDDYSIIANKEEDKINFTIYPINKKFKLSIGEELNLDISNDGIDDLLIRLNGFNNVSADIYVKRLNQYFPNSPKDAAIKIIPTIILATLFEGLLIELFIRKKLFKIRDNLFRYKNISYKIKPLTKSKRMLEITNGNITKTLPVNFNSLSSKLKTSAELKKLGFSKYVHYRILSNINRIFKF